MRDIRDDIKKILQWIPSKTLGSESPFKLDDRGEGVGYFNANLVAKARIACIEAVKTVF